eukprot:4598533-Pleurochrysis_carterae.AAC.3
MALSTAPDDRVWRVSAPLRLSSAKSMRPAVSARISVHPEHSAPRAHRRARSHLDSHVTKCIASSRTWRRQLGGWRCRVIAAAAAAGRCRRAAGPRRRDGRRRAHTEGRGRRREEGRRPSCAAREEREQRLDGRASEVGWAGGGGRSVGLRAIRNVMHTRTDACE